MILGIRKNRNMMFIKNMKCININCLVLSLIFKCCKIVFSHDTINIIQLKFAIRMFQLWKFISYYPGQRTFYILTQIIIVITITIFGFVIETNIIFTSLTMAFFLRFRRFTTKNSLV